MISFATYENINWIKKWRSKRQCNM